MKRKKPFSKTLVMLVIVIAVGFIAFSCYEMHRLCDLTPIAYIGSGIIGLLATVVAMYMWRAKQSDLYDLEIRKIKDKARLRRRLGEYYSDETVTQVQDDNTGGY